MGTRKLNVVADKNIPFLQGNLDKYALVKYVSEQEITPALAKDADALIIRTRTKCNAQLLEGSNCQFIGTATIGTDHIDIPWCQAHGIEVANAPGCNAPAVAQYVFASILRMVNRPIHQYTLGIVGVGNVGKIVEAWARELDMKVLLNDPPRQAAEGGAHWSSLSEIAEQADIITFHTPLDDTTRHLADDEFFKALKRMPIIINAARGPVVDNAALVEAMDAGLVHSAVIDCWEGEPASLNPQLLEKAEIATPHIAGYSIEGKARGTRMVLDAFSEKFGLPRIEIPVEVSAPGAQHVKATRIVKSYDPYADTAALKQNPQAFESLRNTYPLRHEVAGAAASRI